MPEPTKPRKGLSLPLLLTAALAAAMTCYAVVCVKWGEYERFYPLAIAAVLAPLAALACVAAFAAGTRRGKLAMQTMVPVVGFAAVLFGVSAVVNNLLNDGQGNGPRLAVFTSFPVCGMLALWLLAKALAPNWRPRWRKYVAGILALAVLCATCIIQYRHEHLPLPQPVFTTPDLAQNATRSPGTNEFRLAGTSTFNTALIAEKGSAERYYFWDSHLDSVLHKGEAASFRLEAFVDGDWQLVHRGQTADQRAERTHRYAQQQRAQGQTHQHRHWRKRGLCRPHFAQSHGHAGEIGRGLHQQIWVRRRG